MSNSDISTTKERSYAKTSRIPIKIVPLEQTLPKPKWIKAKAPTGSNFALVKKLLRRQTIELV